MYVKGVLESGDRRFQSRQLLACTCQYRRLHIEFFAGHQVQARQCRRYGGVEIVAQVLVDLAETSWQAFGYPGHQRIEGLGIDHISHHPIDTPPVPVI